ncbi:MAG: hypothetical protein JW806_00455 [Sedimentisphaerales bacterium]|nr:hypothetical protein [Sedimentisphaerales bacterium]
MSKEEEEVLSPQQPKITEHLGLSATLFKEQDKRGTIILEFFSDYTIEGDWLGSYYSDPNKTKELDLKGEFKGYIIPDATRAGLDISNDPNKIYFLSYGTFVGVEYDNKGDRPRKVMGIIYVSGWLGPDYTIHQGQVVTTYNEKRFKLFTFSGKAEKLKSGTLRSLMKALQKK